MDGVWAPWATGAQPAAVSSGLSSQLSFAAAPEELLPLRRSQIAEAG
jgi:hypothetical protein